MLQRAPLALALTMAMTACGIDLGKLKPQTSNDRTSSATTGQTADGTPANGATNSNTTPSASTTTGASSSMYLTLPDIGTSAADVIASISLVTASGQVVRQVTLPYTRGGAALVDKIPAGSYTLLVQVSANGNVLFQGSASVTITAGNVSVANVQTSATGADGSLVVNVLPPFPVQSKPTCPDGWPIEAAATSPEIGGPASQAAPGQSAAVASSNGGAASGAASSSAAVSGVPAVTSAPATSASSLDDAVPTPQPATGFVCVPPIPVPPPKPVCAPILSTNDDGSTGSGGGGSLAGAASGSAASGAAVACQPQPPCPPGAECPMIMQYCNPVVPPPIHICAAPSCPPGALCAQPVDQSCGCQVQPPQKVCPLVSATTASIPVGSCIEPLPAAPAPSAPPPQATPATAPAPVQQDPVPSPAPAASPPAPAAPVADPLPEVNGDPVPIGSRVNGDPVPAGGPASNVQ